MSGDGADAADGDVVVVEVVRWPELKSNGSVTAVDTKNDAAFADSGVVMGLVVTAVVVDVGQHAGVENAHREEAGATRFSRQTYWNNGSVSSSRVMAWWRVRSCKV